VRPRETFSLAGGRWLIVDHQSSAIRVDIQRGGGSDRVHHRNPGRHRAEDRGWRSSCRGPAVLLPGRNAAIQYGIAQGELTKAQNEFNAALADAKATCGPYCNVGDVNMPRC
jgi:hypothetical protein